METTNVNITVGVYLNGNYVINIVKGNDLESHIEYNRTMRPGRFLFVDGKYSVGGLLKEELKKEFIKEWEDKISKFKILTRILSKKYI